MSQVLPPARIEGRKECEMATISHEPSRVDKERWTDLLASEMWASLAIAVIWLSVLFDAIYGPDIVSRSAVGDFLTVPSAVVVAFFAFLATWVLARHGYPRNRKSD
jgi:hypothetical protein